VERLRIPPVLLLPDVGSDRTCAQRGGEDLASAADVEFLYGISCIGNDQDFFAIGSFESDVRQRIEGVGFDADGAGANELRYVSHGVVGDESHDFVAVDGDGAAATAATPVVSVGSVVGIGGEIPEQNIFAPVAADADHHPGDGFAEIDGVSSGAIRDGLFGEIEVLVRKLVVNLGHCADVAAVEMKSGAVDVFCRRGVSEDGEGIEGMVEIVIVENDLGLDAGLFEGGAEVIFDEVVLFSMLGVFFSLSGSF